MFRVEFSNRAKKEFYETSDARIEEVIRILSLDPLPAKRYDVKKLKGLNNTFRIRIGKIRIVYTIIWDDNVRHYISPDETVEFTSTYDNKLGEDVEYTYTYVSDPIQKSRVVTKYRTVTKCS